MGQYPTDEELLQMIAEVDDDGSNEIEFSEFLKAHPSRMLSLWNPFGTLPDESRIVQCRQ